MTPKHDKLTVAVTGGIGSGKSLAGKLLSARGYAVIDADRVARDLSGAGGAGALAVAQRFGAQFLTPSGEIDRKKLAAEVFADSEKLKALNAALHPLILDEIDGRVAAAQGGIVFVEVPLLYESGWAARFDRVWAISAPESVRAERAALRGGMTAEQIAQRMNAQATDSQRETIAHAVIQNAGTQKQFEEAVFAELERLTDEFNCS